MDSTKLVEGVSITHLKPNVEGYIMCVMDLKDVNSKVFDFECKFKTGLFAGVRNEFSLNARWDPPSANSTDSSSDSSESDSEVDTDADGESVDRPSYIHLTLYSTMTRTMNWGVDLYQVLAFLIPAADTKLTGTGIPLNKISHEVKKGKHVRKYAAGLNWRQAKEKVVVGVFVHKGNLELEILEEGPFAKYFKSEKLADIQIWVGGRMIPSHRLVLAEKSSVFAAMLEIPMTESHSRVIKIEDFEYESVEEFLQFLYTGTSKSLKGTGEADIIIDVLRLAHKYDVQDLTAKCGVLLIKKLDLENVVKIFALAHLLGMQELAAAAKVFFTLNKTSILPSTPVFQDRLLNAFSADTLYHLFVAEDAK